MHRRAFVGACAAGVVVARSAGAQPSPRTPRVGFLSYTTPAQVAHLLREFTEGLRERGYVDGRDIVIEPHYGDGTQNHLASLAANMVRSRVDVIVTGTNTIATAAKRATSTIPIVMVGTVDPVRAGLVTSLARPGGNVTGLSSDAGPETATKNLELLVELVPGLSRVGLLQQAGDLPAQWLEAAAQRLKLAFHTVDVRTHDEIESAFGVLRQRQVGAVVVRGSLFYVQRQRVADLALKYRLPATHALKEYAHAGLLMTYGADLANLYRRAAGYVERILKGSRPGTLPVERPTKFELVLNQRTAIALGLTLSPSLLLRADEVIR